MNNQDLVIEYLSLFQPPRYSAEERKTLDEPDKRPIVYDEDCPTLTQKQLAKFRRMSQNRLSRLRFRCLKANIGIPRLGNFPGPYSLPRLHVLFQLLAINLSVIVVWKFIIKDIPARHHVHRELCRQELLDLDRGCLPDIA